MRKVIKMLSEAVWDFIKDNLKLVIGNIVAVVVALVPNYINKINSVEFTVNLAFIIFISLIFLILIVNVIFLAKKYKTIKSENYELKNPMNANVSNFEQGDVVILRTDADLPSPPKLSVYKLTKSEIVCRNKRGDLVNYAPEELLTKNETEQVFRTIEYRRQRAEQENKEQWDAFFRSQ